MTPSNTLGTAVKGVATPITLDNNTIGSGGDHGVAGAEGSADVVVVDEVSMEDDSEDEGAVESTGGASPISYVDDDNPDVMLPVTGHANTPLPTFAPLAAKLVAVTTCE